MPVQVLSLVSKGSIEESMIERLSFKRSLFEGALDGGDDTIFLSEDRFKNFMESLAPAFTSPLSNSPLQGEDTAELLAKEVSPRGDSEGVKLFLTSLRDILQSPEKTRQLADAINQILSLTSDSSPKGKEGNNYEL